MKDAVAAAAAKVHFAFCLKRSTLQLANLLLTDKLIFSLATNFIL